MPGTASLDLHVPAHTIGGSTGRERGRSVGRVAFVAASGERFEMTSCVIINRHRVSLSRHHIISVNPPLLFERSDTYPEANMMDATSFNEEDPVQQHSLPEPERRKPYNASTVGRKRTITIAIWSIAGLLIVIVVVAFSLAIVNSTYPSLNEDSTQDSSPAANEADLPSKDEGGVDFDYGGIGGIIDSLSYSSADDGGSYNVDNISTEEPTYFPTYEPTYEVRNNRTRTGILLH